MKKVFKQIVLAALLVAATGCGGYGSKQFDPNRIQQIVQSDKLTDAQIDELIDQYEVILKNLSACTPEEYQQAFKSDSPEIRAIITIGLFLDKHAGQVTQQQLDRIDRIAGEFKLPTAEIGQ